MAGCPKIELHVHLEGSVRPAALLAIAHRNGVSLPASTESEVRALYQFSDFQEFVKTWTLTTNVLQTERDFRQVLVEYAAEAVSHGCVYLEAIFSPTERVRKGMKWETIFNGYCDGAEEARQQYGLEVTLTADMVRGCSLEEAVETVRQCERYRHRGVVGVGLAGIESAAPPSDLAPAFERAHDSGLAVLPHAGETAGPSSIREVLAVLRPHRIRHGIRAVEDTALVEELADRQVVLDVCPTSNVKTGAVPDIARHPLPGLIQAGVLCSVSTDDPAMFDTDLGREYALVASLGVSLRQVFDAGLAGALCSRSSKSDLARARDAYPWPEDARPFPARRPRPRSHHSDRTVEPGGTDLAEGSHQDQTAGG